MSRWCYLVIVAVFMGVCSSTALGEMRTYPTASYIIYSDLPEAAVTEVAVRITLVAKEYDRLTKAFAGSVVGKLPFYLFRKAEDYYAAGGPPNSSGVYTGERLMAIAGDVITEDTWRIVQHEGFHQFVHARIAGNIPIWVNEGLAEYFAEAVFTGDRLVTGLIPPDRLRRVQKRLRANSFHSIPEMMQLGHQAWNREMSSANYDQAWSMVHFLGNGENGSYRANMDGFLLDMGRHGWPWERAWLKHFGPVDGSFEKAWRGYWLSLPDDPSKIGYAEATVITLMNFLAGAVDQHEEFATADEFLRTAEKGELRMTAGAGLVPNLLSSALQRGKKLCRWSLVKQLKKTPLLECALDNGTIITGMFTTGENGGTVRTEISNAPP